MSQTGILKASLAVSAGVAALSCSVLLVFLVWPFFAPIFLGVLAVVAAVSAFALRPLRLPPLSRAAALAVAVALPVGAALFPVATVFVETRLRLPPPHLPGTRIVGTTYLPLSGSTLTGPEPAIAYTYQAAPAGADLETRVSDVLPMQGWSATGRDSYRRGSGRLRVNPYAAPLPGQVTIRISDRFSFVSPLILLLALGATLGRMVIRRISASG